MSTIRAQSRDHSLSLIVAGEVRANLARNRVSALQAAKALGWSYPYMSRRLNGHTPFTVDDLEALAKLLSVSVLDFFPAGGGDVNAHYPKWATQRDRNRPSPTVERSTTIAA